MMLQDLKPLTFHRMAQLNDFEFCCKIRTLTESAATDCGTLCVHPDFSLSLNLLYISSGSGIFYCGILIISKIEIFNAKYLLTRFKSSYCYGK